MPKATPAEKEEMLSSAASTTRRGSAKIVSQSTTKLKGKKSAAKVPATPPASETVTEASSSAVSGSTSQRKVVTQAILDTLETDTMGESWRGALQEEFKKPYFLQLKKFLLAEHSSYTIYPPAEHIYSWSRFTPLEEVKVVILGQDPYHDEGQAHGLSFSVLAPTKPPASLKNIYKQLATDFPDFVIPKNGDLSPIAKQGVLWLNTSLTVRAHKAGSHSKKGWETLTTQAIRAVLARKASEQPGVVFMAWGLPAQNAFAKLGIDESRHLLLKSAHPSPLSAHKGFLGNSHFRLANEWLVKKYGDDAAIDWTVLSGK